MISYNTHKILITLLFKDKKFVKKKIDFNKINYDDLVKLASSHLMIPALYIRLKQNKLLNLINDDFKKYLKYIYELNKSRNNNLMKELIELSTLYVKNEIKHVFLKGSAYMAYNRFNDIGERMVGDIDVLVDKSDYEKSIQLSKKFGYNNNYPSFLNNRHYPRLVHPKKLFALEIHHKLLLKNNKLLSTRSLIQNKIKTEDGVYVPNKIECILHTIYDSQINNYGNLYANISYRHHYDIAFYKSEINELLNFKRSKYINNFFLISDYIGITNTNIIRDRLHIFNRLYLFRFKTKIKFKVYNMLDTFMSIQISFARTRIKKIYRLFKNSKYRLYFFKKIMRKFK